MKSSLVQPSSAGTASAAAAAAPAVAAAASCQLRLEGKRSQTASVSSPKLSGERATATGNAGSNRRKTGTGHSLQWRVGGVPLVPVAVAAAVALPLLVRHVVR
jgi:hypothetical protein